METTDENYVNTHPKNGAVMGWHHFEYKRQLAELDKKIIKLQREKRIISFIPYLMLIVLFLSILIKLF